MDNNAHAPDSVRNNFWDGKIKDEQHSFLAEDGKLNDNGIKAAVQRAFGDLSVRTMTRKGTGKIPCKDFYTEVCEKEEYKFLHHIKIWFESEEKVTAKAYDKWHEEACDIILNFLRTQYEDSSVTYGKAQKVVNMTMKYLYCLKGAEQEQYKEKFQYCHMPLDSFMLEWFWREVAVWYNQPEVRESKKIFRGKIPTWSTMQKEKGDDDTFEKNGKKYYTYSFFVNKIRKFFEENPDKYPGLTPFQAEFYIWPEIQICLSAEELLSRLKSAERITSDERKTQIGCTMKEKLDEVKKAMKKYENLSNDKNP